MDRIDLTTLSAFADDCLFKKHQFAKALREVITQHQMLLLAIEKIGIKVWTPPSGDH